MKKRILWLIIILSVSVPFVWTPACLAATMSYELTDLNGTYTISNTDVYHLVLPDLGTSFTSIDSFSVEYFGEVTAMPLLTNGQGDIIDGHITSGIHLLMEPFPETGYGWEVGVSVPDQLGEFHTQYDFNLSKELNVASSLAEFGISFYHNGYQYGESFYQDGELTMTSVILTLNGDLSMEDSPSTPTPEPGTLILLGSGLFGFAGLRKRAG